MLVDFLIHPILALRSRRLRTELKADAENLHQRVASVLEWANRYIPYTRYADARIASPRKRLRATLKRIDDYIEHLDAGILDRRQLSRLRGDFTEANRNLKDATDRDQHWREQAEKSQTEMKSSRGEAATLDLASLAQVLAPLQRGFYEALRDVERYNSVELVNAAMETAVRRCREYSGHIKRAREVVSELPTIQANFDALNIGQIGSDPQAAQLYHATNATLANAKQKISSGAFADAENKLKVVRKNIATLRAVAERTEMLAEGQILAWLEHSATHRSFHQEFGPKLDSVHRTSGNRTDAWSSLSALILERVMADAGAAWEADRILARNFHSALDLPWPHTISDERGAAVSWKKLIAFCETAKEIANERISFFSSPTE